MSKEFSPVYVPCPECDEEWTERAGDWVSETRVEVVFRCPGCGNTWAYQFVLERGPGVDDQTSRIERNLADPAYANDLRSYVGPDGYTI